MPAGEDKTDRAATRTGGFEVFLEPNVKSAFGTQGDSHRSGFEIKLNL